ncbi:MAG: 3-deoxy-8-phosphooctulonate synthase, partial [Desulfatiglandales bacterium]
SIEIMKGIHRPVVFDATHSVQSPSSNFGITGGERRYVPLLARAAVAAGADGVFFEVHKDPDRALCDAANAIPVKWLKPLIEELLQIWEIVKGGRTYEK